MPHSGQVRHISENWHSEVLEFGRRQLSEEDDPRVGSSRDNSSGGTVTRLAPSSTDSASLSSLGGTLVPVLVFTAVCLLLFLIFRRKCHRVYAPRTISGICTEEERSPPLPEGWFNWIIPFYKIPDSFVLNHGSLDGFLFLRYVKVLGVICVAGCFFLWPVLLPLNGTGGNNLTQLDLLTIGNISRTKKLYGHALMSWLFFSFVLFMIYRECAFFISLRQAYLLAPHYAQRLSSRTVLFTSVPENFLNEELIRKLFGESVQRVWIPQNTNVLRALVKEREQTAVRLERAEIELIKKANAARNRQLRSHSLPSKQTGIVRANLIPSFSAATESRGESYKGHLSNSSVCEGIDEKAKSVEESQSGVDTGIQPGVSEKGMPSGAFCMEYIHPYGLHPSLPDVRGSVAAQWIQASSRPSHRPFTNFGRSIDTIRWTRMRLKRLNTQIAKVRRLYRRGHGQALSAVFVEFENQVAAQTAFQILSHHQPLCMSPRYVGVRPQDVIWTSLRIPWWERIVRRFLVMSFIGVAVLFWSIPSALVGMVSNIEFLATKVPFLSWLTKLPDAITGVVQGLLPALALSWLMAIVPAMLRVCARIAGVPSEPLVELFTQKAYFLFQVVQVFLVTTITSAASAAFTQILKDPLSARNLLAQNLPKASNFYLSYILVQCLAGGAWHLLNLGDLIRHQILTKNIQNPRKRFRLWHRLRAARWGSTYPVFANMGVIAISYSCIAPLILAFTALGMAFTYSVYKYDLILSAESAPDTKGLVYPQALMHLMVGLYLAQICLIGLFTLQSAFGPVGLMVVMLIASIVFHIQLGDAVQPLLYSFPRSLELDEDDLKEEKESEVNYGHDAAPGRSNGAAADYYNMEEGESDDSTDEHVDEGDDTEITARGMEGAGTLTTSVVEVMKSVVQSKGRGKAEAFSQPRGFHKLYQWVKPDPTARPNFVMRWLYPGVYENVFVQSKALRDDIAPFEYERLHVQQAYLQPEMWLLAPKVWIPRDDARVSRQEVAHTRDIVPISDGGAWLDQRGRVVVDMNCSPLIEPKILY